MNRGSVTEVFITTDTFIKKSQILTNPAVLTQSNTDSMTIKILGAFRHYDLGIPESGYIELKAVKQCRLLGIPGP